MKEIMLNFKKSFFLYENSNTRNTVKPILSNLLSPLGKVCVIVVSKLYKKTIIYNKTPINNKFSYDRSAYMNTLLYDEIYGVTFICLRNYCKGLVSVGQKKTHMKVF